MIEMYKSYNDLCSEIEILKIQIDLALKEREQWWIGGRLFHAVPLDNAAERADKLAERLEQMGDELQEKEKAKEKIDQLLQNFEGIEYKILYKRYVENKTLAEIADELGYSHDRIRHIHASIKKDSTSIAQTD